MKRFIMGLFIVMYAACVIAEPLPENKNDNRKKFYFKSYYI